jgi:hypothetical protein
MKEAFSASPTFSLSNKLGRVSWRVVYMTLFKFTCSVVQVAIFCSSSIWR